jgi:hypothetical protein
MALIIASDDVICRGVWDTSTGEYKEDLSLNLDRINQGMHQFSRFEKWPPPTLARDARPPNNGFVIITV